MNLTIWFPYLERSISTNDFDFGNWHLILNWHCSKHKHSASSLNKSLGSKQKENLDWTIFCVSINSMQSLVSGKCIPKKPVIIPFIIKSYACNYIFVLFWRYNNLNSRSLFFILKKIKQSLLKQIKMSWGSWECISNWIMKVLVIRWVFQRKFIKQVFSTYYNFCLRHIECCNWFITLFGSSSHRVIPGGRHEYEHAAEVLFSYLFIEVFIYCSYLQYFNTN